MSNSKPAPEKTLKPRAAKTKKDRMAEALRKNLLRRKSAGAKTTG